MRTLAPLLLALACGLSTSGCGDKSRPPRVEQPAPAIGSIFPSRGPAEGGAMAVLRGLNFRPGATVTFGDRVASGVRVVDSQTLTVEVPPGGPGAVHVLVANEDGQTSTFNGGFTYYLRAPDTAPPPELALITPNTGPSTGGTYAMVTGAHFQEEAVLFIGRAPATETRVVSSELLTGRVAAGAVGAAEVSVTNPDGQTARLPAAFAFSAAEGTGPSLSSVTPQAGGSARETPVTLLGSGFKPGALVFFGGQPASGITLTGEGLLQVLTPRGARGLVDVVVTNPDGRSDVKRGGYNYYEAGPLITSITPRFGAPAGGTSVVVEGGGFYEGATASVGGRSLGSLQRLDERTLLGVTAPGEEGPADILVRNGDGQEDRLVGGFTYGAAPAGELHISRSVPDTGPTSGGTRLTLLGQAFDSSLQVSIGGAPATSVQVLGSSAVSLVTPEGTVGPADIVVTQGGQQARRVKGFWYFDAEGSGTVPTLSQVSPASGPAAGGTQVLLTGSGFSPPLRVFFGPAEATQVKVVSPTVLSAVVPAGAPGPVDVRVQSPQGRLGVLAQGFVYLEPEALGPAPVLVSVLPDSGGTIDPTSVVLETQSAAPGALVFVGGLPASPVSVSSPEHVGTVFPPGAAGPVEVTLTNPDGQTARLPEGFTYVPSPPELSAVSPTTVPLAGEVSLLLTGRGFVPGASVSLGGASVPTTFVDATLLLARAPPHEAGAVDVRVTHPDGQSALLSGALTYADIVLGPPPTLTSVFPASGPSTGGTVALVQGTNLVEGARLVFGDTNSPRVVVMGTGRFSAESPPGPLGQVDLTLINPDGQSAQLVKGFTYVDRATLGAAPVLDAVTPSQGLSTGGTQAVLTGSHFKSGMLVFFGGHLASAALTQTAGIARATTPTGPQGLVDVVVTNTDGQSHRRVGGFLYVAAPLPRSIAPFSGPASGGTPFTLGGTGFAPGAKVFFGDSEATTVTVASPSVITGVTPSAPASEVAVKVVNPDGQSGTFADAFTFIPAPTANALRPAVGPLSGGTAVLITGAGFTPGATVRFGAEQSSHVQVLDSTRLLAVSPPSWAGTVEVVVSNPDEQSATLSHAFRYDTTEFTSGRAMGSVERYLPAARDDTQYRTDVGVVNLSGAPVTVTLKSFDAQGQQRGARALSLPIPPRGRTLVQDALQFIEGVATPTGRQGSILVQADGPIAPFAVLVDRTSNDASVLTGLPASAGSDRLLVPYASSVGVFKTHLSVLNVGSTTATMALKARDAQGVLLAQLAGIVIPPAGQYTTDDVLAELNLPGAVASLELSAPNEWLLAAARTASNTRLGALVTARPYLDAARTQTLAYVPDTTGETSSLLVANMDGANPAAVTLSLHALDGATLGNHSVTVPPNGFTQVGDLARIVLQRQQATQTVSSVRVSADRPIHAMGWVLNTANADLRFFNARSGAGVRLLAPWVSGVASLAVANTGTVAAHVELLLRGDSGAPRGNAFHLSLPPGGLFHTPNLLSALGAGGTSGYLEVRSLNGQPLVALSKVGTEPEGARGDAMDLGSVITAPSLDSLLPTTGPATGGTMARVKGGDFLPGANVLFGGALAQRAQVVDEATAVAVSPPGEVGASVDLTLINFDGSRAVLPNAFGYVDPAQLGLPPAIAAVSPTEVSTLGGTALQVDGSNFEPNPLVFAGMSPATGVTQVNPNRIDAAAPPGVVGPADLTVTNADGQSATLAAALRYVVPPPSVDSVTPGSGPGSGGTAVRLLGHGFQLGATVRFGAVNAASVTVVSTTELQTVTPPGTDGPVAVTVTNPDTQSVTVNNGFSYVAAPLVLSVTPTSGPGAGGTNIQISGKYFREGAMVTIGGVAATAVEVQPGGQVISCTTPAGVAGPAAVEVINPDGQTGLLNNGFTYLAPVPAPTVSAVSPSYGPYTGGTQVTLQGSAFQAGALVKFGDTAAVSSTVISPSAITAVAPGATGPGTVTVTVENPDGQTGSLIGGFTYFQAPDLPDIALISVTPREGPPSGGNIVFISGQGFKVGAQVRFDGLLSPNVTYLGPSALQAEVPPHALLGEVDVTAINPDGLNATLAGGYEYNVGVVFTPPPMRLPMKVERGYGFPYLFDADGDGDLDAFLARRSINCDNDGNDELWLNDGTGTFTLADGFPGDVNRHTISAVMADFDANGTLDILAIPSTSNVAGSFWRNHPQGVFTRSDLPLIGGTSMQQRNAVVGDLNTDGKPDVYVAVDGLSYGYLNNGDGTFTATRSGLPAITNDSRGACIEDFDQDGDDDLFVVNGSNQQANYFLQGPAGTFTLSNDLIPVVGGTNVGCVAAHLRPGAVKDLVVVKAGQSYQYLLNSGTGAFTDEAASLNIHRLPQHPPSASIGVISSLGSSSSPLYIGGVQSLDLDQDGDLDLLMHHYDLKPRFQAYLNDGAGFFGIGTVDRIPEFLSAEAGFAVGDVNSDNRPDVLVSGDGVQSRLLLNSPGGVLRNSTMKSIPDTDFCAYESVAQDIDGDGDPDLILATGCRYSSYSNGCGGEATSCRGETVRVWLSDGAGGFVDATQARFPSFEWSAVELASGDVDGDNDIDLLVGTTGRSSPSSAQDAYGLRLYLNDGSGVFTDVTYPRIPFESYQAQSISLIDFNKDGALDIYVGTFYNCSCGSSQRLYQNTGNGYFFNVSGQLPFSNFCFDLRSSAVADFNGDTYPDIYVGGNGQNKMLFNRGGEAPGYFIDVTASNIPNVNDSTFHTASRDLNGDTRPDLFICNGNSGSTGLDRINLGNATGILSDVTATNWPGESQPYPYPRSGCTTPPTPLASLSCDLEDVDGDGDIDIVAAGASQSNINMRARYYRNVGNAFFEDRTLQSMPYDSDYGTKVQFLHANGDDAPDLFMGTCGQQRLYLNTR